MDNSRRKNTKRNISSGMLNKAVVLLFPFLTRSLIISKLGIEYLGINSLFASILQVLNLSELGFGSAIVFCLYDPIAKGDNKQVCAYMLYLRKAYYYIGIIIMGLGLLVLPFINHLIKGDIPDGLNIYVVYIVYLINTCLGYFAYGYKAIVLNASQRSDIVSNIATFSQALLYLMQLIILIAWSNYYLYIIISPLFVLLNNFLISYYAKKRFPDYICYGELDKSDREKIKTQVVGLMIHKLCQTSRDSFDCIFISAFLGLRISAMYSNYLYIMSTLAGVLAVFGNSMLASVGNSIAIETREKNYNDLKRINSLYMVISGWSTVCLICLYQSFMKKWVGENLMFDSSVVVLLCVYFYLLKMGDIRGMYSDAAGLWWKNRYRAIVESLVNIFLNAILVYYIGVRGVIIATLISLFFINFLYGSRILFREYFNNEGIAGYYFSHLKYAIITSVVMEVTYVVTSRINDTKIEGFLNKTMVTIMVATILYGIVVLLNSESREALKRFFYSRV